MYAATLLRDAARKAGDVIGRLSPQSYPVVQYLDWCHAYAGPLASVLTPAAMDQLLFTRRYWASYETTTFNETFHQTDGIQHELQARQAALEAVAVSLDGLVAEWANQDVEGFAPGRWHALVLDTNVLELHHHQLSTLDWWQKLGLAEGGLRLVIPSVVRDELDAHKLTSNQPWIQKTKVEQRKQASLAVRYLNRTIGEGEHLAALQSVARSQLQLYLQRDELHHRRLPSPDNEIVARALDLVPYAERVYLASYDNNIRFTAELYGIHTLRLDYADIDEATVLASVGGRR